MVTIQQHPIVLHLQQTMAVLSSALLLLLAAPSALGHGYLTNPLCRPRVFGDNYLSMGPNGLGTMAPRTPPNIQVPGHCGDPFQGYSTSYANRWSGVQATYTQGSTITISLTLTSDHGGRHAFRICPRRDSIDEACFGGNWLTREDNGRRYRYTYYQTPYPVDRSYNWRFRLPPQINCDGGCVLQWWWVAYQNGGLRCEDTNTIDTAGECGRPSFGSLLPAGTTPNGWLEQFKQCSDIRITPSSSAPGPSGTLPISTNSRCGASFGNTRCPSGQCCSQYGWCGTAAHHCGTGCQSTFSGTTCWGGGTTAPSLPTAPLGGACGAAAKQRCPSGQCCSQWGYCGTTSGHCSTGCQSAYGICKSK